LPSTEDLPETAMTREELIAEVARLRARLAEPEETVAAIRQGQVDAFVVMEPAGERIYTLATAELLHLVQLVTDSLPVLVSYIDRDRRYRLVNRGYEEWFGRPREEITGAALWEVVGEAAYESIRPHLDRALAGERVAFESELSYPGGETRAIECIYVPHVQDGEVQGLVTFVEDVSERRRTAGALRLLADAGRVLSESPRARDTLALAVRLVVPAFADWSVVDLAIEGGGSERAACYHRDPACQPLMEELARHPPAWEGSIQGDVLASGEPAFSDQLPEPAATAWLHREEHARVVARLAPRSWICVPLVARGRRLGTWSFIYGEGGHRYRPEDVPVAQELGLRVALALDTARLFEELEAASSAKDHFLATLSHELRTPLTPVLAIASRLAAGAGLPPGVRAELEVVRRNVELEARLIDDLLDLTRIARGQLELDRRPLDLREIVRQAVETCGEAKLAAHGLALDLAAPDHQVWGDPARLTQVLWNLLHNALKFTPEGGRIAVRSYLELCNLPSGRVPAVVVEVADSGAGIAPEELTRIFNAFDRGRSGGRDLRGLGLGLAISRSLVEQHGGTLTAASSGPGQGATFTVRLPLGLPASSADAPAGHGTLDSAARQAPAHRDAPALAAREAPAGYGAPDSAARQAPAHREALADAARETPAGPAAPDPADPETAAGADAPGAASPEATAAGLRAPRPAPAPPSPPLPAGKRILLVEDHADSAEALAHLLTDLGHQVTVTASIEESLAAAAAASFDLVVSDLGLPDGHGYDLMRALAARHRLPGIALSGYGMEDDIARGREAGFALHLTKPVSLDALRNALRHLDAAVLPARDPG
jgi:PAS domain S-box-containing protein